MTNNCLPLHRRLYIVTVFAILYISSLCNVLTAISWKTLQNATSTGKIGLLIQNRSAQRSTSILSSSLLSKSRLRRKLGGTEDTTDKTETGTEESNSDEPDETGNEKSKGKIKGNKTKKDKSDEGKDHETDNSKEKVPVEPNPGLVKHKTTAPDDETPEKNVDKPNEANDVPEPAPPAKESEIPPVNQEAESPVAAPSPEEVKVTPPVSIPVTETKTITAPIAIPVTETITVPVVAPEADTIPVPVVAPEAETIPAPVAAPELETIAVPVAIPVTETIPSAVIEPVIENPPTEDNVGEAPITPPSSNIDKPDPPKQEDPPNPELDDDEGPKVDDDEKAGNNNTGEEDNSSEIDTEQEIVDEKPAKDTAVSAPQPAPVVIPATITSDTIDTNESLVDNVPGHFVFGVLVIGVCICVSVRRYRSKNNTNKPFFGRNTNNYTSSFPQYNNNTSSYGKYEGVKTNPDDDDDEDWGWDDEKPKQPQHQRIEMSNMGNRPISGSSPRHRSSSSSPQFGGININNNGTGHHNNSNVSSGNSVSLPPLQYDNYHVSPPTVEKKGFSVKKSGMNNPLRPKTSTTANTTQQSSVGGGNSGGGITSLPSRTITNQPAPLPVSKIVPPSTDDFFAEMGLSKTSNTPKSKFPPTKTTTSTLSSPATAKMSNVKRLGATSIPFDDDDDDLLSGGNNNSNKNNTNTATSWGDDDLDDLLD